MSAPAPLAEVRRGPLVEAVVRGHVAVVDATGRLLASAGDPETLTPVRSAVKPLQALPFLESGAADAIGAGLDEIAIACASHNGEFAHVLAVRSLLARAGADADALACPPHRPYSDAAADELIVVGRRPERVHNNCSGKHAAMLATCLHRGWPVPGYTAPDHPMQEAVAAAIAGCAGVEPAAMEHGVDGCTLPTYGLPVHLLARAFAAAGRRGGAFARCQDAMAARPHLVGGTGRFDTALLAAAGGRVTAKSGGGAVWAAVVRPEGPGLAVKLESGDASALPAVSVHLLQAVGALPEELPAALAAVARPLVRTWGGDPVGEIRSLLDLRAA